MKSTFDWRYPIKFWLTAIIATSIFIIGYYTIQNFRVFQWNVSDLQRSLGASLIYLYLRFVISSISLIPAFGIFALCYNLILKVKLSQILSRTVLLAIAILSMIGTYYLFEGSDVFSVTDYYYQVNLVLFTGLGILAAAIVHKITK